MKKVKFTSSKVFRISIFCLIIIIGIIVNHYPVFFQNKTLQTGGLGQMGGELVGGLWSQRNAEKISPFERPVIDPGSSAYNEELFPYAINTILKDGQIPLWNPYQGCGTPLAANPLASAFYPPMLIPSLFPGSFSWDFFLLLRLFIAGILMFGFLRIIDVSIPGCIVGAFGYIFSGYFTQYINLFHLNVDCLIPGLFWSIEMIAKGGISYRRGLLFAIILFALMFLGAHPESLIIAFGSGFIYLLIRLFTISWTRRTRGEAVFSKISLSILWYGFALLIGFLLTLYLMLPFFEYYFNSRHTHSENIGTSFLPIYNSITLLSPFLHFNKYRMMLNYWMTSSGFILTLLVVFAYPKTQGRRGLVVALMLTIFFIYTKVTGFMFINWIGKLPFLKLIFFTKYMAVMYFAIAALAAIGIDHIHKKSYNRKTAFAGSIIYLIFILLLYIRNLQKFNVPALSDPLIMTYFYSMTFLVLPAFILIFISIKAKSHKISALLIWAIVLMASVELFIYIPKQRAERLPRLEPPPFVNKLKEKHGSDNYPWRIYGVDAAMIPLYSTAYNLYDARNISPLDYGPYWKYMKTFLTAKSLTTAKDSVFDEMFTGCQYPEVVFSGYLDLLGIKYVISENYLNTPSYHEYFMQKCRILTPDSNIHRGYRLGYYYIGIQTPAVFEIDVDVPPEGDKLVFDSFVDVKEMYKLRGGVRFDVYIQDGDTSKTVHSRLVNLMRNLDDGQYRMFEVSLNEYAGKRITITFQARGDLENGNRINALWRNLYLASWEKKNFSNLRMIFDGEAKIYENSKVLPRAFIADNVVLSVTDDEMTTKMLDQNWNPLHTIMMFEKDKKKIKPEFLQPQEEKSPSDSQKVAITKYTANYVEILVKAEKPAMLILSDTFFPGWKAEVNGKRSEIYRANLFMRAIQIERGENRIIFRYNPESFRYGIYISAFMVLCIIAGVLFKRRDNAGHSNIDSDERGN